ncbi:hypothetical protein VTL71DRAFT_9086 [Oculimacula yallundae]|uniref:Uncharacterized protein n=1 Tax=Oculimacula yallundae TaxID=86028 RepID=A0ABR4BTR1_9HELO
MTGEKATTEHIEYALGQDTQSTAASTPGIDQVHLIPVSTNHSDIKIPSEASKSDSQRDQIFPIVTVQSVPTAPSTARVNPDIQTSSRIGRMWNSFEDRWIFETLCCLWAAFMLFAMIITLVIHQEKSIPSWPYSISINSLIAIFTALMKAALMVVVAAAISQLKWDWFGEPHPLVDLEYFDAATRGPWAACILMLAARKHYLASFGALITILALAIDPFSQQIIQYYPCIESVPGSVSSLPQANNYTNGGFLSKPGYAELDSTMAAAMYMGTIDAPRNPSSIIDFDCSTGNCTFPAVQNATFQSLGICSSVMDIAHHIRPNITQNITVGYWLPDLSGGMPADNANYAEAKVGQSDLVTSGPAQSLVTIANSHWKMLQPKKVVENGPGFLPEFDALFTFDTIMLKVNSSCQVTDNDIHLSESCEKSPWAFRASLYPCIKTYRSRIFKSEPQEEVISTLPLRRTNASAIEVTKTDHLTYSFATDRILVNGSWQDCKVSEHYTDSTPVPISVNKTLQLYPKEPTLWYPNECIWVLEYVPALALNQFLSWMFDESPLLAVTSNTVVTAGSLWLKPLYRNGTADMESVSKYMDGLTNAMTAVIRQRGSGRVFGTVQSSQTCIHVNWVWISLPSGLVGLTILLLTCTILSCRRSDLWSATRSWRCSSLALLFHGCNDGVRQRMPDTVSSREMMKASENLVVELKKTSNGLKFLERVSA